MSLAYVKVEVELMDLSFLKDLFYFNCNPEKTSPAANEMFLVVEIRALFCYGSENSLKVRK